MKFSIDRFEVGYTRKTSFNYIYTVTSSKLSIIIQSRDYCRSFFVKNSSVLAVVQKIQKTHIKWAC